MQRPAGALELLLPKRGRHKRKGRDGGGEEQEEEQEEWGGGGRDDGGSRHGVEGFQEHGKSGKRQRLGSHELAGRES